MIALVLALLYASGSSTDSPLELRTQAASTDVPVDDGDRNSWFERTKPPALTQEPREGASSRLSVRSLGRLSEAELAVVISEWEEALERLQAELAMDLAPRPPLEKELHETQLLWRIDKRIEAIAMLRHGEYITFEGPAPACPDDCEPITRSWAGQLDGKSVGLAVYIPIESKLLKESTVRYRNAYDAYWRSKASQFNALPLDDRIARIQAHDQLSARLLDLQKAKKSSEALAEMKQLRSELLTQGPLYLERSSSTLAFQ